MTTDRAGRLIPAARVSVHTQIDSNFFWNSFYGSPVSGQQARMMNADPSDQKLLQLATGTTDQSI